MLRSLSLALLAASACAQSCTFNGVQGSCIDVNTATCTGTLRTGLCPGAANIKCCDPVGTACAASGLSGTCINTANTGCSGTLQSGLCPGSSSIRCCLRPAAPANGCTTSINGYSGACKAVASCAGGTFNGLCTGTSSIKCCVDDPNPAPVAAPHVTLAQFQNSFEAISATRARGMLPYFNAALATVLSGAPTAQARCNRLAAFVAQVGHESAGLLYFEEIASGAAYEGRTDLGNTQPGDGVRFKGRGPIQLTGRANYNAAGNALGLALTTYPESVSFPSVGFRTTAWYWTSRNLNTYADSGTTADFTTLTRRINGGTNGLSDRQSRWAAAKSTFNC